jgi:4-amino-4-deoxy-L-arabinose transferase-like glycosyltransferase
MRNYLTVATVSGVVLFVLFFQLGTLQLLNPDEGRNSGVALEMARSGEWIVPTYNGAAYLDKPALYFSWVAASFRIFGPSEAAARLPSVLAAIGTLLLCVWFARRVYDSEVAAIAALAVATMPLFLVLARTVIFDMPLTFFVTAAILFAYRAFDRPSLSRRWIVASAAAAGVATLIKGPVGFLVPGLVTVVVAAVDRRGKSLWKSFFPLAAVVMLAVVVPWFVALSIKRPDFPHYGLVVESFQRFTTDDFRRSGPWYYYAPVLMGVCFGWSMLFPEAFLAAARNSRALCRPDRFLIVWVVTVVAFFSVSSSKLPGYVLPAMVPLGILAARICSSASRDRSGRAARILRRSTVLLAVAAVAIMAWCLLDLYSPSVLEQLKLTQGTDYGKFQVLFPSILRMAVVLVALCGVSLARRSARVAVLAFGLAGASLAVLPPSAMEAMSARASSRELAILIESRAPGADVVLVESFSNGLGFYLGRVPLLVTRDGTETTSNYISYSLRSPDPWPDTLIPVARFREWLSMNPDAVLLVAQGEQRATLDMIASEQGLVVQPLIADWWSLLRPPRR